MLVKDFSTEKRSMGVNRVVVDGKAERGEKTKTKRERDARV